MVFDIPVTLCASWLYEHPVIIM